MVEKLSVLVGVCAKKVETLFHDSVVGFLMSGIPKNVTNLGYHREAASGHDIARNRIAKIFLDGNYDWLYSWDADMAHPPWALHRLLDTAKRVNGKVVSGLYYARGPPQQGMRYQLDHRLHTPHVYMKKHPDAYHEKNPPSDWRNYVLVGDVMKVDGIGFGCCIVHRDAFLKVEKEGLTPYFQVRSYQNGTSWSIGEDLWFCDSLRKAGVTIYCDTTIVGIQHQMTATVMDGCAVGWSL